MPRPEVLSPQRRWRPQSGSAAAGCQAWRLALCGRRRPKGRTWSPHRPPSPTICEVHSEEAATEGALELLSQSQLRCIQDLSQPTGVRKPARGKAVPPGRVEGRRRGAATAWGPSRASRSLAAPVFLAVPHRPARPASWCPGGVSRSPRATSHLTGSPRARAVLPARPWPWRDSPVTPWLRDSVPHRR